MNVSNFELIYFDAETDNLTKFHGINITHDELDKCTDVDGNKSTYFTYRITIDVFIIGILCIFGILGNIISIVVINSGKITSAKTTKFLLQGLSICDSSYLIMAFISSTLRGIMKYTQWGDPFFGLHPYMYRYIWALTAIARLLVVNFVVLVTIERYVATCHPLNVKLWFTQKRIRVTAVVIVLESFLLNIPRFFDLNPVNYDNCTHILNAGGYADYLELNGMLFSVVYVTGIYYAANVIIPLTMLLILNAKIVMTLKRAFNGAETMGSTMSLNQRAVQKVQKKEKSITIMCFVVVLVFMICQTPAFVINIVYTLYSVGVNVPDRKMMSYWYCMGTTLVVLNSATNFGIYYVFSKQFRQVLGEYLSHIKCVWSRDGNGRSEDTQQNIQSTSSFESLTQHM